MHTFHFPIRVGFNVLKYVMAFSSSSTYALSHYSDLISVKLNVKTRTHQISIYMQLVFIYIFFFTNRLIALFVARL